MRNYRKEYTKYHITPKQKKDRAARNKARRKALKEGKVTKGGSYDVHHIDANPRNNSSKNIAITHRKSNRGQLKYRNRRKMYSA